jgi:D-alanyl-D-alanine carboxypeptidase
MIQIGAYTTAAEAQRRLADAQNRARKALGAARPVTQAISVGGRQLFRARFAGLDATAAAGACNELRRLQIDCQVTPG